MTAEENPQPSRQCHLRESKLNKTEQQATSKQKARRKRTLELWIKGLTQEQIATKMREEGFHTSRHTVCIDLHSVTADEELKELKRQQHADITLANEDYKIRLEYRDREIDRLTPRKIQAQVSGTVTFVLKGYDFEDKPKPKPEPENKPECES